MSPRALVLVMAVTACAPVDVELGRPPTDAGVDAPIDAARPIDASTCRCRIAPCRSAGDCALTGGTCGADMFCTGDFGACSADSQCQATTPAGLCTRGTTSVERCGP